MLFVDEFDPHEPFDTPEPWASRYDPDWEGPHLIWPPYMQGAIEKGVLTPRQAQQLRASYGGKLSMIDHWFGPGSHLEARREPCERHDSHADRRCVGAIVFRLPPLPDHPRGAPTAVEAGNTADAAPAGGRATPAERCRRPAW